MTPQDLARCVDLFDTVRRRRGATAAMAHVLEFAKAPTKERRAVVMDSAAALDPCVVAIIRAVEANHGVSPTAECNLSRRRVAIRDEAVYLARAICGASYPELGRYFGRDSSTLVTGGQRFAARLAADEVLAARMARIVGEKRGAAEEARAAS